MNNAQTFQTHFIYKSEKGNRIIELKKTNKKQPKFIQQSNYQDNDYTGI